MSAAENRWSPARSAHGAGTWKRSARWSAVLLSYLVGASVATAKADAQRFEVTLTPAPASTLELAPLPHVAIVPAGGALISRELAAQLDEATAIATREASDGSWFMASIHERAGVSEVGWAFAARTDVRTQYGELSQQFARWLSECLNSLPASDVELTAVLTLLAPASLPDETALEHAIAGAEHMLQNWRNDRCQTRQNSLPFVARQSATVTEAARGMLTGEFDALTFHGQALLDLIDVLEILFFESGGLWEADRRPRLEALFRAALERGFAASDAYVSGASQTFTSFFDWLIHMRRLQPRARAVPNRGGRVPTGRRGRQSFFRSRRMSHGWQARPADTVVRAAGASLSAGEEHAVMGPRCAGSQAGRGSLARAKLAVLTLLLGVPACDAGAGHSAAANRSDASQHEERDEPDASSSADGAQASGDAALSADRCREEQLAELTSSLGDASLVAVIDVLLDKLADGEHVRYCSDL